MNTDFNLKEKIVVIEANGYEVKKETRKFWMSTYHNSTEEYDKDIFAVYKNGKEVIEYDSSSSEYYVDKIFAEIYKKKITNILCN